ncbi:MAG: hypothetical protein R3F14_23870 [Polyangiaceae bacterium]
MSLSPFWHSATAKAPSTHWRLGLGLSPLHLTPVRCSAAHEVLIAVAAHEAVVVQLGGAALAGFQAAVAAALIFGLLAEALAAGGLLAGDLGGLGLDAGVERGGDELVVDAVLIGVVTLALEASGGEALEGVDVFCLADAEELASR